MNYQNVNEKQEPIYTVYQLEDPRFPAGSPHRVRYIGCSSMFLHSRLSRHTAEARRTRGRAFVATAPKAVWLRELENYGYEPIISAIATTTDAAEAFKVEVAEIAKARASGYFITNTCTSLIGGRPRGTRCSAEGKARIAASWKHPTQLKRRMAAAERCGQRLSAHVRATYYDKLVAFARDFNSTVTPTLEKWLDINRADYVWLKAILRANKVPARGQARISNLLAQLA